MDVRVGHREILEGILEFGWCWTGADGVEFAVEAAGAVVECVPEAVVECDAVVVWCGGPWVRMGVGSLSVARRGVR